MRDETSEQGLERLLRASVELMVATSRYMEHFDYCRTRAFPRMGECTCVAGEPLAKAREQMQSVLAYFGRFARIAAKIQDGGFQP